MKLADILHITGMNIDLFDFIPIHKKPREIIDVDYIEITDEGEIHHAVNQKLIDNGTERLYNRRTESRDQSPA